MAVAIDMEDIIAAELRANPDYSLVLVGHSMGAGCASLLATFWEEKFNNLRVYLFGGPCVAPLDSHPTNNTAIINVISEGDPFQCLSLGHMADISAAVARFCDEPDLRREALSRTEGRLNEIDMDDLRFCWEAMEEFRRNVMTNPNKMFPPGALHATNGNAQLVAGRSLLGASETVQLTYRTFRKNILRYQTTAYCIRSSEWLLN